MARPDGQTWSGEATRNQGFAVEETRVDINLGDDSSSEVVAERKARPIWMTESTVINEDNHDTTDSILQEAASASIIQNTPATIGAPSNNRNKKETEDIMAVLLQHEKQPGQKESHLKGLKLGSSAANSSDSSDDERDIENAQIRRFSF